MEARIEISNVALFECEKAKGDSGNKIEEVELVGKKIFNIKSKKYEQLKNTLEFNIKKKLESKYSKDLSKKDKNDSFTGQLFPEVSSQGAKAISVIFNLNVEKKKSILEKILDSDNLEDFKENCFSLARKYVSYSKKLKGVLGVIQFELITPNQNEKFISVITADFSASAISTDSEVAIKALDKAFDSNFKTIILFPFLEGRKSDIFFISGKEAKVHQKTIASDPSILLATELDGPDFPQKILEDLYEKNAPSLKEVYKKLEELGEGYSKKSYVMLNFCGKNVRISFYDFMNHFDIIAENGGQGLFLHGKEVDVKIGKNNLLEDRRIEKISLEKLSKKISKN